MITIFKKRKFLELKKKFHHFIYTHWKPLSFLFCWSSIVTISLSCIPLFYRFCPNDARFCQWLPLSEIISIATASYLLWLSLHVIFGTYVVQQEKHYDDLLTFSNIFNLAVFFSMWISMLPELLFLNKFLSEILFPVHMAQDLQTSYCEGIKILSGGRSSSHVYRICARGGTAAWRKLSLTAKFSFTRYISCHDRRFFMHTALIFFQFFNCIHWILSDYNIPTPESMRRSPASSLQSSTYTFMPPPSYEEVNSSPPPYSSIYPDGYGAPINTGP